MRFMMVAALAVAAPVAMAQPAMPDFDPAAFCRRSLASIGHGESQFLLNGCLMQEQAAYDGLKARWPSIPESAVRQCERSLRSIGISSYALLQGCIQQEEAARQQNQQFQFRR